MVVHSTPCHVLMNSTFHHILTAKNLPSSTGLHAVLVLEMFEICWKSATRLKISMDVLQNQNHLMAGRSDVGARPETHWSGGAAVLGLR